MKTKRILVVICFFVFAVANTLSLTDYDWMSESRKPNANFCEI